jgi:hypothetical protein
MIAMPKFMLLLHESPAHRPELSPGDMAKMIQEYRNWSDRLRAEGKLVVADKLTNDPGKVLRPGKDGAVAVTDGPFAESKEVIGGYYCVEATDYAAAAEIAKGSPHLKFGGSIELRKIDFT